MKILGIDPGTAIVGWGVIEHEKGISKMINYGVILTKSTAAMIDRLSIIYDELMQILSLYMPDQCAVEELFFNNNAKTAITVGQARGVILLAIRQNNVPCYEYTPLEVKNALTGYGRAQKPQIQALVKMILKLETIPKPDDAADALAIALIHTQYAKMNAIESCGIKKNNQK